MNTRAPYRPWYRISLVGITFILACDFMLASGLIRLATEKNSIDRVFVGVPLALFLILGLAALIAMLRDFAPALLSGSARSPCQPDQSNAQ